MKSIKPYIPFFRANIMQIYIYRGAVWLWLLVDVFQFVMMIFLWQSVYSEQAVIGGFTLNDMLVYYLLTIFFFIFTEIEAMFIMGEEIKEGRISLYLIKPIKYRLRLYAETAGRAIGIAMLILPIITIVGIIMTVILHISWQMTLEQIVLALLYIPLIFVLMFEYSFLFGTLVIYLNNIFGLAIFMSMFIRMVSGQLIPLILYPDVLYKIVTTLPFKYVSYPPLILLGKIGMDQAWLGLLFLGVWGLIFVLINRIIFKFSIKKMVVFGG